MAGSKVPHSSHKKSQFWLELVQAQATSGLGIADFCKQQNVSDSAFYKWRAKLAQEQLQGYLEQPPTQPNQRFTELVIRDTPQTITSSTPVPAPALELSNPEKLLKVQFGEIRIEIPAGFDPETLRTVFGMLRSGSC